MNKPFLLLLLLALLLVACGQATEPGPARILYLTPDEAGQLQLAVINQDGGESQVLTSAEFGIFDFTVAPDGHAVTLTWNVSQSTTELWQLKFDNGQASEPQQLISCQPGVCQNPAWANDNRRIVYERRNAEGFEPQLWWLDSQTGDSIPVFNDESIQGYYPRLAPDDEFLSFVMIPAPSEDDAAALQSLLPEGHSVNDGHNHTIARSQQIALYNFETGSRLLIPNLMNSQVRWRPGVEEPEVLFVDMQFFGERFGMHLLHADVNENRVIDISDVRLVEDASPNWSPDGSQIAFTRKEANTAMGRQLWLMDSDGENGRALSANAVLHHGEPIWSPSAELLLFQRFDTTTPNAVPGVWVYDLVGDEPREISGHGFRPKWLP